MSGLDFDDIHTDLSAALAEFSRLLRIVPLTSAPAEQVVELRHDFLPAGSGDHFQVIA